MSISRRLAAQALGMVGAGWLVGAGARPARAAQGGGLAIAGRPAELTVAAVGPDVVRITLAPVEDGRPLPVPPDGSLVPLDQAPPVLQLRALPEARRFDCGGARVAVEPGPTLTIRVEAADGRAVQRLRVDMATGVVTFDLGDGPVFGLGEGGPQFDRRGSVDRMRSGQGGYRLRTHGGRVPIPWLIGTRAGRSSSTVLTARST